MSIAFDFFKSQPLYSTQNMVFYPTTFPCNIHITYQFPYVHVLWYLICNITYQYPFILHISIHLIHLIPASKSAEVWCFTWHHRRHRCFLAWQPRSATTASPRHAAALGCHAAGKKDQETCGVYQQKWCSYQEKSWFCQHCLLLGWKVQKIPRIQGWKLKPPTRLVLFFSGQWKE